MLESGQPKMMMKQALDALERELRGRRLAATAEACDTVKPAPFDYHAPRRWTRRSPLLAEHGSDAKPLAGGQSLIPGHELPARDACVLVDLNGIEALAYVTADGGSGPRLAA